MQKCLPPGLRTMLISSKKTQTKHTPYPSFPKQTEKRITQHILEILKEKQNDFEMSVRQIHSLEKTGESCLELKCFCLFNPILQWF